MFGKNKKVKEGSAEERERLTKKATQFADSLIKSGGKKVIEEFIEKFGDKPVFESEMHKEILINVLRSKLNDNGSQVEPQGVIVFGGSGKPKIVTQNKELEGEFDVMTRAADMALKQMGYKEGVNKLQEYTNQLFREKKFDQFLELRDKLRDELESAK